MFLQAAKLQKRDEKTASLAEKHKKKE